MKSIEELARDLCFIFWDDSYLTKEQIQEQVLKESKFMDLARYVHSLIIEGKIEELKFARIKVLENQKPTMDNCVVCEFGPDITMEEDKFFVAARNLAIDMRIAELEAERGE